MDFSDYKVIAAPGLMHMTQILKERLAASGAEIVLGPRSGARDESMRIPVPLPPDMPGLSVTVARLESLRADSPVALKGGGRAILYREVLEGEADILEQTEQGGPVVMAHGRLRYVGAWLDQTALTRVLRAACEAAGVETRDMQRACACATLGANGSGSTTPRKNAILGI